MNSSQDRISLSTSGSRHDALFTLAHLNPLLKSFTHRHKNQHRASHWFSALSVLRRCLSRLEQDVKSPARPKVAASNNNNNNNNYNVDARVQTRAQWIKVHVLPRAFMYGSVLTAFSLTPFHLPLSYFCGRLHKHT